MPETYVADMGLGMNAEIQLGDAKATGKLSALSPEVVKNQVLARVRFDGEQPKGLRQNQRVSGAPADRGKAERGDAAARPLRRERRRPLRLRDARRRRRAHADHAGRDQRLGVEILSGLKPGDKVVVAGTDTFANAAASPSTITGSPTERTSHAAHDQSEQGVPHPHDRDARAARLRDPRQPGRVRHRDRPSGSGKTSFLNIAGLLEEFTDGEYILDGVNVKGMDDNARSRLRNEKLGFIFQGFNLIPDLSLFDNVDVPLRYRGFNAAERKERIEDALAKVGLASRMKHYPAELSGGQQQRVAIARALAGSPKLLLADEPTGNLDTQMARGVMELLEEINAQGTTILMVTHDPELAVRAQRNVHIIDGQVSDLVRKAPSLFDAKAAQRG
jgi:putative ABC transport system ATP-binding protein